jgi:transcriptional regulator with XRE-family HTH domain
LVESPTTAATSPPLATLAKRLRDLRHSGFPNADLTQGDIARALSVAVSTLSTWENVQKPTLPSHRHLASYARFFATERSLEGASPHLIPLAELSASENETRSKLERELFRLRDNDAGEASSIRQSWRFDDGAPITVICSELTKSNRVKLGPLSDVDNPNYTALYSYGDLDALVELLSHLHSSNPGSYITFCLASQVTGKQLVNHIVLLGGIAWNDVTRRLNASANLPVQQVQTERIHSGEVFEIDRKSDHGQQFLPRWQDDDPGTQERPGVLLEDVAMLARLPNPYNTLRTLTYCNGIHSRGVLGAVRCLTDEDVRDENESYLQETFVDSDRFVVLMRVRVMGSQTISPILKNPSDVLFQWPAADDRAVS